MTEWRNVFIFVSTVFLVIVIYSLALEVEHYKEKYRRMYEISLNKYKQGLQEGRCCDVSLCKNLQEPEFIPNDPNGYYVNIEDVIPPSLSSPSSP